MFFLPCAEKYGDNEFHGGKAFKKKTTLVVAIVVKKRTLGQISFIMQKQTDNPVLSMISCTVQKQMVQTCSKITDGGCKNEGYATLSKGLFKKWKL